MDNHSSSPLRALRVGAAILFGTTLAFAATETDLPETLSWEQCVEIAARANPELLAAGNQLRAAEHSQSGSYAIFFPQISGYAGFKREAGGKLGVDPNHSTGYSAGLVAKLNLFSGFQDRARVDEATAKRQQAESLLQVAKAKASFELKSAFAGLAYAQTWIQLARDFVERREANARLIELRFESGRENKGSLLLARSYVDQAQLDAIQSGNSLTVSQAQLARVLGRENPSVLRVAGAVPVSAPPGAPEMPALARSLPDYRHAAAQERVADAGIDIARAPFFPSLNVSGEYGRGGSEFFPRENHGWKLEVGVSIPLFNGGRDYYATKSAIESKKAAALGKDNALRTGVVKLQQALSGFVEAVRRLEVNRHFVDAVATRSRIAREKYNNGLLTFEDWDVIENDYINRQRALLETVRDRVVAEASWEQAQGKGVFP